MSKNGKLCFYKDKKTADSGATDIGFTDLRYLNNIVVSTDTKNDGPFCLLLEANKDSCKLKFKSEEDMMTWKKVLTEWKTYVIEREKLGISKSSPQKPKPKFDSKLDENLYDLDNIVIEDTEQEKKSSAWFGNFNFGVKKEDIEVDNDFNDKQVIDKPAKLQGWLEKKGKGKFTSEWQKKYCKVDESTSSLLYSKSKEFDEDQSGSIDLRQVTSIAMNSKPSKDSFSRFDIDTGDRVYKFKAKSKVEAENWVANLNLWREYLLLQMT